MSESVKDFHQEFQKHNFNVGIDLVFLSRFQKI